MKSRTHPDLNWILILLLAVFAVAPLTYPGFFEASSGFLPAFNAAHPSDAPEWQGLVGPVRGEGRLSYLLAWPFYALSRSGVVAIKWGYALAFLIGAIGIYAWTRRWIGGKGGVLSATVYVYLPWHLGTAYTRGAYAEAWLWAFWPWILWAVDFVVNGRPRVAALGIATCLVLAAATLWIHPGLAALALPLFVAYGVMVTDGKQRHWLLGALGAALIGLWFAASRTAETGIPFSDQFLHPFQLLSATWGDGLSYQLGLAAVGLSIVAIALQAGRRESPSNAGGIAEGDDVAASAPEIAYSLSLPQHRVFWFWVCALAALILLCLPVSAWLWQLSGFDALLTYPWQLLALTALPLAFLAGSVIRLDGRLSELPAWAGVVALVILASYPYLAPRFTQVDPGPEPVALLQPVEASAPQILLLDYTVERTAEVAATQMLTVTLSWQAVEPVANDYTAFVHVLAVDGTKIAQRDSRPCDGECPTGTWQPGEVITDRYLLDLTQDTGTAKPERLAVGLYLLESGDRAIVVGREDRMVLLDVP